MNLAHETPLSVVFAVEEIAISRKANHGFLFLHGCADINNAQL